MKRARNEKELNRVREKILEAALDIIVNKGYDALTMRLLASRIGMTAPNIYNYYSGKEALYFSLVNRGFEKLLKQLSKAYYSTDDKFSRVRAIFETYVIFGITNPRYYDIMFNRFIPYYTDTAEDLPKGIPDSERQISKNLVNMTKSAIQEVLGNDIDDFTVQMRVVQIWSMLHGMVSLYNSRVISYISSDAKGVYSGIIDEFIHMWGLFSPFETD